MLAIKIELWPYGDQSKAKVLGMCMIANDGTGDQETGNYYAIFKDDKCEKKSEVKSFPRLRLNAFDLLFRALRGAFGDRNEKE